MDDETICVTKPTIAFDGYDSLAAPTCRASTIPFADADAYASRLDRGDDGYVYGLYGTPTHRYLESKICALERGHRTLLVPSGQAAAALVMLSVLEAGQSVLIPDTAYPPVRDFAVRDLNRIGVQAAFYDPTDLDTLSELITSDTGLVWVESPGSTTMEFQDVARIVEIAGAKDVLVGCDNTWATPLLFKPLEHGADISAEALSKYIGGHSDLLMGSISVRDPRLGSRIKATLGRLGIGVSPDDCYLVLRGLETLGVRLKRAGDVAQVMAEWIAQQPLVERVLHPMFQDCPGHEVWRRDYTAASGVFSVLLREEAVSHVYSAMNSLETFVIGASWGGTKSLLVPMPISQHRTVVPWEGPDLVLRLSIGLESENLLKQDLERFFGTIESLISDSQHHGPGQKDRQLA